MKLTLVDEPPEDYCLLTCGLVTLMGLCSSVLTWMMVTEHCLSAWPVLTVSVQRPILTPGSPLRIRSKSLSRSLYLATAPALVFQCYTPTLLSWTSPWRPGDIIVRCHDGYGFSVKKTLMLDMIVI